VKKQTLKSSFGHFGARLKSRQSWSGISEDSRVVVLTCWFDRYKVQGLAAGYSCFGEEDGDWQTERPNFERKEHIRHALAHCDELVRVVVVIAKDTKQKTREIANSWPKLNAWFRITKFDEETGEFELALVSMEACNDNSAPKALTSKRPESKKV